MLVINCSDLFQMQRGAGGVTQLKIPSELKPWEFEDLHNEGKKLINGWFESAVRLVDNEFDHFEGFIYLWIAFNSWASCVTAVDRDRDIIDSLSADRIITEEFDRLLAEKGTDFEINAWRFHNLLPIFDAKHLAKENLLVHEFQFDFDGLRTRSERRSHYFAAEVERFEPKCWKRHDDANENVPLDWPHILCAIYKVRCNLFHGRKGIHSEMDRKIVSAAFLTLIHFITNTPAIQIGKVVVD